MNTRCGKAVDVVVPAGVDDPSRPSGGNHYDRRLCEALAGLGWDVRERAVAGTWPTPSMRESAALADVLSSSGRDGRVVLLDGLLAAGAGDVVAEAAARAPVVILVHMAFGAGQPGIVQVEQSERRAFSAATRLVATSRWTADLLGRAYGVSADRIGVAIPGATRPGTPPGETPVRDGGGSRLLCVAAVTRAKGLDALVSALEELAGDGGPGWTCTVAGRLDLDRRFVLAMRGRLASAGLASRVRFAGVATRPELDALYRASDLLVVPSRSETWGMVVTEALSHGLPVVAGRVGGLPEALGLSPDGDLPGLLVPPADPAVLAAALRRWLADAPLRARLRAAAAARAGDLPGWDETARRVGEALRAAARP